MPTRGVYEFFLSLCPLWQKKEMTKQRKQSGFTLVELLMALMVGSIVLAAAASMADAMSCGKRATEQMARSANYLAQLQIRLPDLIMRAGGIEAIAGGVNLTYDDGETVKLYSDDSKRIIVEENGLVYSYLSEPTQKNVSIALVDVNRVAISFDIIENGVDQTYTMTATRRGGQH